MRTARSARDHTGTRAGSNGRRWPNGLRLLPGRPTASRNRVARGGTQGGPNCLTHALPRCLPTPTEEADGNGYGVITGRSDPPGPPSRVSVNQVPLLLTGVRLHPPGRTDKNLCRCFGAPATHVRRPHCRVFPDHLISKCSLPYLLTYQKWVGVHDGSGVRSGVRMRGTRHDASLASPSASTSSVTHARVGSRPLSIAFSHVSQTSGGKITNISYVCQVEIESTHVSGLSRSCRILEGVFFLL